MNQPVTIRSSSDDGTIDWPACVSPRPSALKYWVTENWLVWTDWPPKNSYVVGTTFKK